MTKGIPIRPYMSFSFPLSLLSNSEKCFHLFCFHVSSAFLICPPIILVGDMTAISMARALQILIISFTEVTLLSLVELCKMKFYIHHFITSYGFLISHCAVPGYHISCNLLEKTHKTPFLLCGFNLKKKSFWLGSMIYLGFGLETKLFSI